MKKILIVIDCQKDFIDGVLANPDAQAAMDAVVAKIKTYPIENVYATRDTHEANYMETREGRFLPVPHCIEGTPGWEIHERIKDLLDGATFFNKPSFGSVALADHIAKLAQKEEIEIEMIGFCTDICVVANAMLLKAMLPETDIIVDSACCAGVTPALHQAALDVMKSCQIIIK